MITCPKCAHQFEPTEAMERQVRKSLAAEFQTELDAVNRRAAERVASERERLSAEMDRRDAEIRKAAAAEREKIAADARDAVSAELVAANEALASQEKRLRDAQQRELDLRKQARELEAAKASMELEVARKLDEERGRIASEAEERVSSQHSMQRAEWEKTRGDLLRQVEELRQKATQGSTQLQGEVFELAIEELLRDSFPDDSIEEVAKGVKGGDVTQHVQTRSGVICGKILWELKRTKSFSHGWVSKLKEDKRTSKADHAVIVTTAMPEGIKTVGQIEGVWVVCADSVLGIAVALRSSLLEAERIRASFAGRKDKLDALYEYVNGVDFRNQITALVESFVSMKEDLEGERRAMEKIWAKRDKQISRSVSTIAGVYGGLQGLVHLEAIPQLELSPR